MRAALFIMRATNSSLVFTFYLYTSLFIHLDRQKSDLHAPTSNSCIFTPIENWTQVYMNLFTRNSQYYHLLKCLLLPLKHPVYVFITRYQCVQSKKDGRCNATRWRAEKCVQVVGWEDVDWVNVAQYRTSGRRLCT